MSVTAQTAEQIQVQLLNYLLSLSSAPVTDYNDGSVIQLVGADVAGQLEAYYEAGFIQDQEALQTMLYQMFQFPPLPAVNAYVQVQIANSTSTAQPVNAGALVTIPNSTIQYSTQSTVTVPANSNTVVTIVCTTPGSIGNCPANSITQFVNPISGLTVTNPQAVITGKDPETADQRAARFQNFLKQLRRGDKGALEAGATTANLTDASGYITETVTRAVASDGAYAVISGSYALVSSAGYASVWVYNGVGSMSSGLLSLTQNIVNGYTDAQGIKHTGYKAAGVIASVLQALQQPTSIAIALYPAPGYTMAMITGAVTLAVQGVFANLDIGQALQVSDLLYAVRQVPGVGNAQILTPNSDPPAITGLIYTLNGTPTYSAMAA